MPVPIILRGLMWLATGLGLGSWFGGDTIENQTVIKETTLTEKILWAVLLGLVLILLARLANKKWRFFK